MNNILVDKQCFTDIANAIREVNGEETKYKPSEMALAITQLGGGTEILITATVETGSTVTATKSDESNITASATSVGNQAVLTVPKAGTYNVYAELNGIRSETVQVVCNCNYPTTIKYIKLTVTVDSGSSVTVSKDLYSYNKASNGTAIFYLPEIGTWNIKATLDDKETSDTISISAYKDYTLELEYFHVDSTLNNNTWEKISEASTLGVASSTWSVGDEKQIIINGTVGTVSFKSFKISAFIIGFNHNENTEGKNLTHFCIGKINGKQVALVDNYYQTETYQDDNAFCHGGRNAWGLNPISTNVIGTRNNPLSPSSNTLMAALPSDLRAVMKPITKYAAYVYGSGTATAKAKIDKSTDYLSILDEPEIIGNTNDVTSTVFNYEKQYEYFKNSSNNRVFYKYNDTNTTCYLLLRSAILVEHAAWYAVLTKPDDGIRKSESYCAGIVSIFAVGGEAA